MATGSGRRACTWTHRGSSENPNENCAAQISSLEKERLPGLEAWPGSRSGNGTGQFQLMVIGTLRTSSGVCPRACSAWLLPPRLAALMRMLLETGK